MTTSRNAGVLVYIVAATVSCLYTAAGWRRHRVARIADFPEDTSMLAHLRETDIYFDVDGSALVPDGRRMSGRPTAMVVHGGPGMDHSSGKVVYGRLAERMQLVYFDQRGQGRSARGDPLRYTLDENVEDMEALRRYLGLGTVISIGTSYGGMVAMAHAARYPTAVSHLILVVTAAHSGFIQRAIEIVTERGTVEEIGHCRDLFQGKVDTPEKLRRFFEGMGRMYSLKHDPTSFKHSLERCILTVDPLNRAFAPNGFLRDFDLRLELNAVRAPTLILAGRHDWICAPQFSEEIHRLILGSDLRIFEESSHFIGADEPQNLLDVITGFVIYQGASTEPRI